MLIFDIETNKFSDELPGDKINDIHTIHCIVAYDREARQYYIFDPDNLPIGVFYDMMEEHGVIAGHNIIGYDIPVLHKLSEKYTDNKFSFEKIKIFDTFVLSQYINSYFLENRDYQAIKMNKYTVKNPGSHSIEAYGQRYGMLKGDYLKETDGDVWEPAMTDYCFRDVEINVRLFNELKDTKWIKDPQVKESMKMEHFVQQMMAYQQRQGVMLDRNGMLKFYHELSGRKLDVERQLKEIFPPIMISGGEFIPKRDNKTRGYVKNVPFCKIKEQVFNPGSTQQIVQRFKTKYGWQPKEFTEKDNPKMDEDVMIYLRDIEKFPEAEPLLQYALLNKRMSQMVDGKKAWLKFMTEEDRIHGRVNPLGTISSRMSHSNPNLAQVPASYSPYGKECRSFFIAPPGYRLVGCDAEQLEARNLAHYLYPYDDGALIKTILSGDKKQGNDFHSLNADALECDRDTAKTWFYAWMYGAAHFKQSTILKCNVREASEKEKTFLENIPALLEFKSDLLAQVKKRKPKYVVALDGRHLCVRSLHSALNLLIQGCGAIVMKRALVILVDELKKINIEIGVHYHPVLNVHDEFQNYVLDRDGLPEIVADKSALSIKLAGEYYNMNCPQQGEAKIGNCWLETH